MHKVIILGVMVSGFLLLMTPCISAIQIHEVQEEIEFRIQDNSLLFNLNLLNNQDSIFIGSLIKTLFLIYVIGYFAFLPFAWALAVGIPYSDPSFLELLISTILGSFLWPIIVLDIIRAYIEDVNILQRI